MIDVNYKTNKKRHKNKKIVYLIIFMLITFLLGQKIYADSIERVSIVLNDINLYTKLETALNSYKNVIYNPSTKTIEFPVSEIENVKQLDVSNAGIQDLTGIEKFTALIELNASANSISDISNLYSLQNLKVINLASNQQFTDAGQLKNISGIQNINLYNTGITNITEFRNIPTLKTLNIGQTSISDVAPLQNLELTELYLSGLTGLRDIDAIIPIKTLRRLDISGCTSITDLGSTNVAEGGIYSLSNLEYLNINSTRASSSGNALIAKTYTEKENGVTVTKPYLGNLQELRANDTTGIPFSTLSKVSTLKIIYMSNCTSTISLSKIYELDNLEEVYLDGNKISSIKDFNLYKTENGITYCIDHLSASKISLANNKLVDISPFAEFDSNQIKYLNLSSNMIPDISVLERFNYDGRPQANLNLANQQLGMTVRKKTNTEDQYMILYPIMQSAMSSSSVAYTSNNRFICSEDCYLNPDPKYNVSPYFNIIIENETLYKNPAPVMTVRLNGGVANGTTITYTISTSTSSIDSLIFPDPNLAMGVSAQLKKDKKYYINALNIINLETSIETGQTVFDLRSLNIADLTGLSNFINIQTLDLSNNKFTNISELQYLTKLKILNLSNNNIGDNNDTLTNLRNLTSLSLGNTGMTNLYFLEALNIATKNKMPITLLDIQSNRISDLTEIGKLPNLANLNISKNKVSDLTPISEKQTLTHLNISSNNIDDISIVGNFNKLMVFNCDNNLVKDITPLSYCSSLNELSIKENLISNIEPLRYLTLYSFHCDNNNIKDINPIENMAFTSESEETPFTAYIQLIAEVLDDDATGNITITLPEIFASAKNSNSKVYTTKDFTASNCTLSSDNKTITLNVEELGDKIASVTINGGYADGTKFSLAPALKGYINYSIKQLTNKDVVATITFNRPNVTVLNNDGKTEYTFTKNGEFTFQFEDENGFTGETTAKVDWIDKEGPKLSYKSEEVGDNGNILITIESDEEINTYPSGWTRSGNKYSLTKEFSNSATETVVVTDNVGNESSIKVSTEIDRSTLTSKTYTIDEESLFVTKVYPKTTVDDFNDKVESTGSYSVVDSNGNTLSGSNYVTTGSKVVFNEGTKVKEYTISVLGDLDSNGLVAVKDLAILQKMILKVVSNPSDLLKKSSDVNSDNTFNVSDLAGIQRYILSNGEYEFKPKQ